MLKKEKIRKIILLSVYFKGNVGIKLVVLIANFKIVFIQYYCIYSR